MEGTVTPLQQIDPDKIRRNPDNPRLIFREDDMNELLESIREVGVKVPISVYRSDGKYTLIDGERRWRCVKKLNHKSIPAIIQPKPTRLENLLMMFNIHNVRVDWDLMPTALKLGEIRQMLEREGKPTTPKDLAVVTGVRLPTVRRALDLLGLPKKYQRALIKEAEKPRKEQRVTADLFIEIYKSLHAVERYTPEVFKDVTRSEYIHSMVHKYTRGVVDNVVGYREVSRIARAERAGVNRLKAMPVIVRLVKDEDYSVKNAFKDTVEAAYEQRDLLTRLRATIEKLSEYKTGVHLDDPTRAALRELGDEVSRLLGNER